MATRADYPRAWLPEAVGPLVVQPVQESSVAMQTATVLRVGEYETLRIPIVTEDPRAEWVAEGEEISPEDLVVDEVAVTPAKVAGLSVITRELAEDSTPAAAEQVGRGLARDIARRVDEAFFGNLSAPAPSGLESLSGVQEVDAGPSWSGLDPFIEAVAALEAVGVTASVFVANPLDALALAKIKESADSNRPLLQPDPTQPTRKVIYGVPLWTSPAVSVGTVWCWDRSRVVVALRQDVSLDIDRSAFFTSDRIAIRAIMRVGFGFPHEAAIAAVRLSS